MDFKTWIFSDNAKTASSGLSIEGFGFDTQDMSDRVSRKLYTPYQTVTKNVPPSRPEDMHKKFVRQTKRNNQDNDRHMNIDQIVKFDQESKSLSYKEEDDPSDLLRLIHLDKIVQLPTMEIDDRLPSFEGGSIYYAFTFTPSEQFSVRSRDKKAIYADTTFDSDIERLQKQMTFNKNRMDRIRKMHPISKLEEKTPNLEMIVRAAMQDIHVYDQRAMKAINQKLTGTGIVLTSLPQIQMLQQWFGSSERIEFVKLVQDQNRLQMLIKPQSRNVLDTKDSRKFFEDACLAMAKILKKPRTPNQQEKQAQFIQLSVQAVTTKMQGKGYDYVIWPESSSSFNQLLGEALAEHYGAYPMQGFSKLTKGESQVDITSAIKNGKNHLSILKQFDRMRGVVREKDVVGLDGKTRLGKIINNGKNQKDDKPEIKKVDYGRPYMRIWKIEKPEGVNYKKARILIIDDNSSSGATMQAVHKLLIQEKPRYVDMFIPLQLKNYVRTSTVDSKSGIS